MSMTVREGLERIEQVLLEARGEERFGAGALDGILAVLTALRGPDEDSKQGLKSKTTAVIRRAAFPKLDWLHTPHDSPAIGSRVTLEPWEATHFESHVRAAAKALDIFDEAPGQSQSQSQSQSQDQK